MANGRRDQLEVSPIFFAGKPLAVRESCFAGDEIEKTIPSGMKNGGRREARTRDLRVANAPYDPTRKDTE
jgi:hypothetical protein